MRNLEPEINNLSGSLIAAHPSLKDPNFDRSVILLSVHSAEEGAVGVVVNRPCSKTLGEIDEHFAWGPLSEVPVFDGGPVAKDQMLLSAWKHQEDAGVFKLYFGITEEKAIEILSKDPQVELRGFLGHAGWSSGQIEGEIQQDAWVVTGMNTQIISELSGVAMWRHLLAAVDLNLGFLADEPDDLSMN